MTQAESLKLTSAGVPTRHQRMRAAIAAALLLASVASEITPCDDDCAPGLVRSTVGNATAEDEFVACVADSDEEDCICSLLRLGWVGSPPEEQGVLYGWL